MSFRYVALGDSQSEGLGDTPWPDGTPRGWTDRLAGYLSAQHEDFEYANLAVRGLRAHEVRRSQLRAAKQLQPDLVTITAGMNDMLRPRLDEPRLRADLTALVSELTAQGAQVLLLPLPDVRDVMPVARLITGRILSLNTVIGDLAEEYGAVAVSDPDGVVFQDRRAWSPDLLHLSPLGHERLAMAAADALGLPGFTEWGSPLTGPSLPVGLRQDLTWWATYVGPWLTRRLRGKSSAQGRVAKRPEPLPLGAV